MAASSLDRLQSWFLSQCNDDWEHGKGIRIETLDNPGWHLVIDLADTSLESRAFATVKYGIPDRFDIEDDHTDPDWIDCRVEDRQYRAAGGPMKLDELIGVFLTWAEATMPQATS